MGSGAMKRADSFEAGRVVHRVAKVHAVRNCGKKVIHTRQKEKIIKKK